MLPAYITSVFRICNFGYSCMADDMNDIEQRQVILDEIVKLELELDVAANEPEVDIEPAVKAYNDALDAYNYAKSYMHQERNKIAEKRKAIIELRKKIGKKRNELVEVLIKNECPKCKGAGRQDRAHGWLDCDNCNGTGWVK